MADPNAYQQRTVDEIHEFLHAADRLMRDARFLLNSIPNVDMNAVQRVVPLLESILDVLSDLEDPELGFEDIDGLKQTVIASLEPLRQYRDKPQLFFPVNLPPRAVDDSNKGPPFFSIDLGRAIELHNMGNSWQDVADAIGVNRGTIYNHLHRAGISTARKEFSDVSDEDLDALVCAISLEHPLSGRQIVKGHLESLGLHLSDTRVMASLQRVDPIGVLLR
jgi:hypothetical protein